MSPRPSSRTGRGETATREAGRRWEAIAERYLRAQGMNAFVRNYRCRLGEIDLVMRDGDTLVMVEVRYRRTASHGGAAGSVTPSKQQRLARAARHFLAHHRLAHRPVRFDVLAITGTPMSYRFDWRRCAFDARE